MTKRILDKLIKDYELGDPKAALNIGVMYVDGLGVEQDYKQAMEWYSKAN